MKGKILASVALLSLLASCGPTQSTIGSSGPGEESSSDIGKDSSNPPLDTSWDPNVPTDPSLFEYEIWDSQWGEVAAITGFKGGVPNYPYALVIPSEIDGYPVMATGHAAFKPDIHNGGIDGIDKNGLGLSDNHIHHVVLPDNFKSIGSFSFNSLIALEDIVIPYGVERIANMAFYKCYSLREVTVPSSVTYFDHSIFCRCETLQRADIQAQITVLRAETFNQCYNLSEVAIPDTIEEIERIAFASCRKLESIDLPSSLRIIGNGAFQQAGLTSLDLPEGVEEIGDYAFAKTKIEEVVIPSGCEVGKLAFVDCPNLKRVCFEDASHPSLDFGDTQGVEVVYGYQA